MRMLARAVDLPWRNISEMSKDSIFILRGAIKPIEKTLNPFSWESTSFRHGYRYECRVHFASRPLHNKDYWLERAQRSLEERVKFVLGNNERAGLLLSMSIGTRDVLSLPTERAFKMTGLAHLLVVSGYQVTLFYYLVFNVLRWIATRSATICLTIPVTLWASALALAASLLFVVLAGIEGSSVRAALALLFVVAASNLERRGGMGTSIVVSLLLLSSIWPGAYLEPGVELTYAALTGIFLGMRGNDKSWKTFLRVCLYASLCTSLVVLIWFGNLSLIGFLLNPIAAPVLSFIGCYGGFLAMGLNFIGLDPHGYLLQLVSYFLVKGRDAIWWLSRLGLALERVEGVALYSIAAILAAVIAYIAYRRLKHFKMEYNL